MMVGGESINAVEENTRPPYGGTPRRGVARVKGSARPFLKKGEKYAK